MPIGSTSLHLKPFVKLSLKFVLDSHLPAVFDSWDENQKPLSHFVCKRTA